MNRLQELMVITMEECGELTQQCSKVIRKSKTVDEVSQSQRVKLLEEAGDVYCMIELMISHGLMTHDEIVERSNVKAEKLKQWSKLYGLDE